MSTNIYDLLHQQPINTASTTPPKLAENLSRYQTNELSFVRPAGFLDQTFHIFSQTETGPSPFSIVIGRSRISGEDTLEELTQRLQREMEHSLSEFKLIGLQEGGVDNLPARAIEYSWKQQGKTLQQIQILFLHQDEQGEPLSIQITGTSSNPQGMTDEERQRFITFVTSIRLRYEAI